MIFDRYIGHGDYLSDHLCHVCGRTDCDCSAPGSAPICDDCDDRCVQVGGCDPCAR